MEGENKPTERDVDFNNLSNLFAIARKHLSESRDQMIFLLNFEDKLNDALNDYHNKKEENKGDS
jgi:hypothetical protein